jgi:hypothetical protein
MTSKLFKNIEFLLPEKAETFNGMEYFHPINLRGSMEGTPSPQNIGEFKSVILDNEVGFHNPILMSFRSARETNFRYKVILSQNGYTFCVDLHHTTLHDQIMHGEIEGGELKGKFVFVRVGSVTKLISVESPIYLKIVRGDMEDNSRKKLTPGKLIPGTLYKLGKSSDNYSLYLGKSYVSEMVNQHTRMELSLDVKSTHLFVDFKYNQSNYRDIGTQVLLLTSGENRSLYTLLPNELPNYYDNCYIESNVMDTTDIIYYFKLFYLSDKNVLRDFLGRYNEVSFTRTLLNKISGNYSYPIRKIAEIMNSEYSQLVDTYGLHKI